MKTIFKYAITNLIDDEIGINMPKGAKVLSAQAQKNNVCIWAMVDMDASVGLVAEKRMFKIFGTGHELKYENGNLEFISTVQLFDGDLVLHVFEYLPARGI